MTDELDALAIADDAALAVYADPLQQLGDPRGELIALDLAGKPVDVARWLGEPLAKQLATSGSKVERGFVAARFAGSYIDGAVPRCAAREPGRAVPATGVDRRRSSVGRQGSDDARGRATPVARVARDLPAPRRDAADAAARSRDVDRLVAATPHLEYLDLAGYRLATSLVHPRVHTLRVTGVDVIALGAGEPTAVEVLDLEFQHGVDRHALAETTSSRASFPKLVRLDVSRNEPGGDPPSYLAGRPDPFRFVAEPDVLPQLIELRVPSVRSDGQHVDLQTALDRAPSLQRVELARSYGFPVRLRQRAPRSRSPSRGRGRRPTPCTPATR